MLDRGLIVWSDPYLILYSVCASSEVQAGLHGKVDLIELCRTLIKLVQKS